jgi:dUTP pyrophosphatase
MTTKKKVEVNKIIIKYIMLNEFAKEPLVSEGNACFDFYAVSDVDIAGHSAKVHTGIAVEIPEGYHMKLFMRSSMGSKTSIRLANCVGIIDSSYRGEIMAVFDNLARVQTIRRGDRFLQGLVEKNIPVEFKKSKKLSDTKRGSGGFGSTGGVVNG